MAFTSVNVMLPSCGDDNDEPENVDKPDTPSKADVDDSRIFGTWVGEFWDTKFTLTFSEDGKMTEIVDGESGVYTYSLTKGKLTITPNTSALNNIMGDNIEVSFKGSKLIIACNLWNMELSKR